MNHHLSDLILDYLLDGVLIVNKEGQILYVNNAAEKLLGQPAEKLTGQSFGFPVAPNEVQQIELVRNGELLIVQLLASAIPWKGQDACVLSIRDITALVKASQELELQKQKLESTNDDLEQYASLASHDLKEPLRKITLYSEMLLHKLDTTSKENTQDLLNKIHDAAVRMRMLMNGIAEFAKTSKESFEFTAVDLNEVVKDVLCDLEIMIAETRAIIRVEELPTIRAVRIQMHQLFLNIISNAMKYAKQGVAPRITVKQLESNESVEICITDNGIGFDSAYAEKVFLPFHRLKDVAKEGSGIGLTICKKIVETHGGKIAVSSEPGQGSRFTFSLAKSA